MLEYILEGKVTIDQDWVVKEEMWRDISKSYNIELIYEDRNQVVRRARALDLKVAQVKYGNY